MKDLLQKTQELCKRYGIKPARSKGQNFLINEEIFDSIVSFADLDNKDIVLEVGPGLGFLTWKLAEKAGQVMAVELDDKLAAYLQTAIKAKGFDNIEVINENILEIFNFQFSIFNKFLISKFKKYRIVANLPYNISSIFLRKVFKLEKKPELLVLMLQKEVAERIVAKPGKMSLLAVSVQFYAEAKIMQYVPKSDFWPEPEVDSAIIELKVYPPTHKALARRSERDFFRLVKFGFSSKRKMLKNNLAGGFKIEQAEAEDKIIKAGLNPKARAQELSLDDWGRLYEEFCV